MGIVSLNKRQKSQKKVLPYDIRNELPFISVINVGVKISDILKFKIEYVVNPKLKM